MAEGEARREGPLVYGHPFINFVTGLADGTFPDAAQEVLRELVEAVRETHRAGTLQIAVRVEPDKHDTGRLFFEVQKLEAKRPVAKRPTTVFFATEDGALSRRDPRQPALPGLAEVHRADAADVHAAAERSAQ